MIKLRRSSNSELIEVDEAATLHRGGEGSVFPFPGKPELAIKLYHDTDSEERRQRRYRKLQAMMAAPPGGAEPGEGLSAAWPTELLLDPDSERLMGFAMGYLRDAHNLVTVTNQRQRAQHFPSFTIKSLHEVAINVCIAVHNVHEKGYVIGDISDSNVLVNADGMCTLVDTDSFQVTDPATQEVYRCGVGRPEFTPRELQGIDLSSIDRGPEHDLFGLGVMLFKLLMNGQHPYNGRVEDDGLQRLKDRIAHGNFPWGPERTPIRVPHGAPFLDALDPQLQLAFRHCFYEGTRDPERRPTALRWYEVLAASTERLARCSVASGHYYSDHLRSCPWCELAAPAPEPAKPVVRPEPPKPAPDQDDVSGNGGVDSELERLEEALGRAEQQKKGAGKKPQPAAPPKHPPQPRHPIHPGKWRIEPDMANSPLGALGAMVQHKLDLDLRRDGTMSGLSKTNAMGMQLPMSLEGQWGYDPPSKTLHFNGVLRAQPSRMGGGLFGGFGGMMMPQMPPQPYRCSYTLHTGANDRYQAFDSEKGLPWMIYKI